MVFLNEPLVIRMERYRVLVPTAIVVPAAAFGCYRALSTQDDPVQWVIAILAPVIALLVSAHYVWFYYIAVDANSVTQVKYFGLIRKVIPISRLSRVGAGVFRGALFNSQSVRFISSSDAIEVIADIYDRRGMADAIAELHKRGVPIDSQLLHRYSIS